METKTTSLGPTGRRWTISEPTDAVRRAISDMPDDSRLDRFLGTDTELVIEATSRRAVAIVEDALKAALPKAESQSGEPRVRMASEAQKGYLRTLIQKHQTDVVGGLIGDAFDYPKDLDSLTMEYASTLITEIKADLGWY